MQVDGSLCPAHVGMWNCVFHSCLTFSEVRFADPLTWILSIIQHIMHDGSWVLDRTTSAMFIHFVLPVLRGRDMQAFVTHEHALRKKARCIFIFAMAALGLASFALIHLGDGFFVKAGELVAVVASICILQYSPCFLDVFKLTTSIFQMALRQPQAIPLQHLGTSCHSNSFRFPEAGPASHVFDLS